MKIRYYIIIFCLLIFSSCINKNNDKVLVYNISAPVETFNPKLVRETISQQVNTMINEGLLSFNESNGKYYGALAKSYYEKDNKIYFTIRDNIFWSNGEKIKVDDFIFGLKLALNKKTAAQYADMLFSIKNASEYNKGKINFDEVGIKKVSSNSFYIELNKPTPYFKYILTLPISYPINEIFYNQYKDEYGTDKDKLLYSGAYIIDKKIIQKFI